MSEFAPDEPVAQPAEPDLVSARLVLDIAGSPEEVRQSIEAVRTLAGLLGIRAAVGEPLDADSLPPSEVLADKAEAELHRQLEQSIKPVLRRHTFGPNPALHPPQGDSESRLISTIDRQLGWHGITTLRDLLVVGAQYVRDVRLMGPKAYALIASALAGELGTDVEWLDNPRPHDAAKWCSNVGQINGVVVGDEHRQETLEQLLEIGDEKARKYAAAFWAARRRLIEARQGNIG